MVSSNNKKNKLNTLNNSLDYQLEEFVKDVGIDIQKYSQEEIEIFYNISIKLFNRLFDKWKKERLSSVK